MEGVTMKKPFLSATELAETARSKVPVICSGVPGTLCVLRDGSVLFHADEDPTTSTWHHKCCVWQNPQVQVKAGDLVGAMLEGDDSVRVWSCTLDGSNAAQPVRRLQRSSPLQCESAEAAEKAVALLRQQAAVNHRKGDGGMLQRRALVIINPHSGQGLAARAFRNTVAPVLAAAGFEVNAHETLARGHATQIVAAEDLGSYEAVVAVGGDGTVFEVLQGYFQRPDYKAAIETPICLVPSGSGNGLAANCGLWSAETAAFAVVRGRRRPIDIFSVLQPGGGRRCYGFLSIYYGLMANLDRGTEHLRWLGNIRFTLGALHQVWQQRRYAARVAVYPADSAPPPDPDAPAAAPDARPYQEQRDDTGGTEPDGALQHDGPYQPPGHMRTRSAEQTALQPSSMQQHREQRQPQNSSSRGCLSALCRPGPPTPILDALGDAADVDLEAIAQQHPDWRLVPALETAFFAAVNLPLLDLTSLTGPRAGFETGCLDVMHVPDLASRSEALDFLHYLEVGKHLNLETVRLDKAAALIIEPLSSGTWLMVDGEDIAYERIYVEVHPGLCSVIIA